PDHAAAAWQPGWLDLPAGLTANDDRPPIITTMRIAWFSPLPPERSGIATYSGDLLPRLGRSHTIHAFSAANARHILWKARRNQYDLVAYQLGNAACHDFMWGYLAAFQGLVVLHDARLHHARARALLR